MAGLDPAICFGEYGRCLTVFRQMPGSSLIKSGHNESMITAVGIRGALAARSPPGQRSGIRCMLRGMKRRRLIVLPVAAGAEQRAMPLFGCFSGTWHDLDARFVAARGGPAQADEVIE
jgi:hypothetical protein